MADGADISLKENGPILVTGEFTLTGEDGQPFTDLNPTIALCRCGLSANKPFCDGSHSSQGWSSKKSGGGPGDRAPRLGPAGGEARDVGEALRRNARLAQLVRVGHPDLAVLHGPRQVERGFDGP